MENKKYLEQYIQTHRESFDNEPAPRCGWDNLERSLQRIQADTMAGFVAANRLELDIYTCPDNLWNKIDAALGNSTTVQPSDGIERFIQQNRDSFDQAVPDLRIWEQLAKRKTIKLSVSWKRQLVRSAAAIAFLVTGVGIGIWYASHWQDPMAGMRMSEVSAEYAELENHFERDIDAKKQSLATFVSDNSASDVLNDLQQMDKVMEELRIELAEVPPGNREEIVRAMIDHYKTKAMVLEKVLRALKEHSLDNIDDRNDQNSNSSNYENVRI